MHGIDPILIKFLAVVTMPIAYPIHSYARFHVSCPDVGWKKDGEADGEMRDRQKKKEPKYFFGRNIRLRLGKR